MLKRMRTMLGKTALGRLKEKVIKRKPAITRPHFLSSVDSSQKTLLIVCDAGFNQDFPTATSLMRIGFARGWASVCGPAKLISVYELMHEIELHDKPAVFMSVYDFSYLTLPQSVRLRSLDTFVWASVHPRVIPEFEQKFMFEKGQTDTRTWSEAYPKIMAAEPKFVWNSAGRTGLHWYQGWIDDGLRWETIHPAADVERYFPDSSPAEYGHIKMAYVGGYWAEKAQAFDLYLRPWEEILNTFGHTQWPYKNYGGLIDEVMERQIYSTAGLIPLVTSPGGWLMAEITERYLKAPACRAFCIADENPAVRELFAEDEMLQAESAEHFHHFVREMLDGKIDTEHWRNQAYKAVLERHLYTHRAVQILEALSGH